MTATDERFGLWVITHRWWIIAATIACVGVTASGIPFLSINNDARAFFGTENPQLRALELLERTYTKEQGVVFAVAPRSGDVFTPRTLAALHGLTQACWKLRRANRVSSITNFQHARARGDEIVIEDLVPNPETLDTPSAHRIRDIALSEPRLVNRLVSASGHVAGVHVSIALPPDARAEVTRVIAAARDTADEFRRTHPDLDLHLGGGLMAEAAFGEASRHDLTTLVPFVVVAVTLVTGAALRSLVGTIATLLVIMMSLATALGCAGWCGISITPASANAPTIILTLGLADSIHILMTFFQRMRDGAAQLEALRDSLRINRQAVTLTSVTTAIGFLSMNWSDAPPFRHLGNMVATGTVAALVYSILFLPAFLAVLPLQPFGHRASPRSSFWTSLAALLAARRQLVLWGTSAAMTIVAVGALRIELDDDWIRYFGPDYEIRRATDFMERNLTGYQTIEYSLEAGERGGVSNPAYLATLERFARWYGQQPNVVHVSTISDTMKRLNQALHGDDPSFYRLPERRELAAQSLLLYEMSLPFGLDLNNEIDLDKSASRMIVTVRGTTTRELRALDERARAWLRANAPSSMFTYGSGLAVIWAHLSERNVNGMLAASFGALLLISAILTLALRSVRLGIISLAPNVAPALMALGIWGVIVGRVGLGASVIVSLTLGIVVDDTIHFLNHYLRARREDGVSPTAAVGAALQGAGPAMGATTAALVLGFSVLALSAYRMNADMGLLAAMTIALALALDYLCLPALLMTVDRREPLVGREGETPCVSRAPTASRLPQAGLWPTTSSMRWHRGTPRGRRRKTEERGW